MNRSMEAMLRAGIEGMWRSGARAPERDWVGLREQRRAERIRPLLDLMRRWVTAPRHPVPRPVLDDPEQRHIGFLIVPRFRAPATRKARPSPVAERDGLKLPAHAFAKLRGLAAARRMLS